MGKEIKTFLDEVAEQLLASEYALDTIKIVVPSNRSIRFLNEALKKVIDRPTFAPIIVNIETFIEELSGLHRISNSSLLFELYRVYKDNTPEEYAESFNQYLSWASGLLQEFNDIDAYLIPQEELFSYLIDLEKISNWGSETPMIKNFVSFNKRLPKYYNVLYEKLLNDRLGYAGMQYREAIHNLEFYLDTNNSHHFFVGFNALNSAEEKIIQEFLSNDKGTVIWDIDAEFYEDSFHVSGHFIRKYYKEWTPLRHLPKPKFKSNFKSPKKIEIISVAKNTTQAKYAAQLVKELKDTDKGTTAVILGQESLLIPLVSGISAFTKEWNVTMGYPLEATTVASFFNLWIQLHQYPNQGQLDFFNVELLLESCSVSKLFGAAEKNLLTLMDDFRLKNSVLIPHQKLTSISGDDTVGKLLFEPFSNVLNFLERLLELCNRGYDYFYDKVNLDSKLLASYFLRFKEIFRQLQLLQEKFLFIKGLAEFKVLFSSILKVETIDFRGEPLEGTQVMGLLETRLLDFENVIITNVNEGILPSGKGVSAFIPFSVKKKYGLPTYLEQDTIFSYHFFRVLQRAKKVYLLYNSTSEGLFSGEKSRFLYQLEYFHSSQHELLLKQVNTNFSEIKDDLKTIEKTPPVIEALKQIAKEGLSPSSLSLYVKNPYLFYEQRVLGIREPKTLESTITVMDKGTMIHNVLELLYKPYLNISLTPEHYDAMISVYESVVQQEYKVIYHGSETVSGMNYIVYELTKEIIKNFLENEKAFVAGGNSLKILALEEQFSVPVLHPKLDFPIELKGMVDRIEEVNGTIRIVDYKTGTVEKKDLTLNEWDILIEDSKKSPLFQVLLYAYVFKDRFPNHDHITAGVISFRNYKNDFYPFSLKNNRSAHPMPLEEAHYTALEEQFFLLLDELFNKEIPFEWKE